MHWGWWLLIAYLVLQSQQRSNTATVTGSTTSPGYTGGFGINLIF